MPRSDDPPHCVHFIIHCLCVDGSTQPLYQKIEFAFLRLLKMKKKKRHLTLHTMSKFRLRAASLGCFTDKQVQVGDKQISQPWVFFRSVYVRERDNEHKLSYDGE